MRTTFARSLIAIIALVFVCSAAAQESSLTHRITQLNRQIEVTRPSRGSSTSVTSQQMESALASRQTLVEQLIRTNPLAVRAVRLRASVTSSLPTSAQQMVEADVTMSGVLQQTIGDDFEHNRSLTVWNLQSADKRVEVVFAEAAHPELLVGRNVEIAGVGTSNVVAVESIQPIHAKPHSQARSALGPAPLTCSTLGTQNVAVLMMNQGTGGATYPTGITPTFLQNEYFSATPKSLPTYWGETSVNQTSATGQVFGPFTLDRVYSCSETNALATKAISLAQAGGVDLSGFTRVSIVFPTDNTCGLGGLGDIGCRAADSQVDHPYSISWIPIFSYYNGATDLWGTLAHELGHNLGLGHGNSLDFGTTPLGTIDYAPILPGSGSASSSVALNSEYGDQFTVMGQSKCGGQYSSFAKTQYLNWQPFSELYEVTTGGNFTINPYESTSGTRALRILRDPATSSWLWLEYRQPQGTYDSLLQGCLTNTNVYQGALGYYESQYSSDGHLYLVDFHPSSAPNDFKDAALLPGETWSDPYSPLNVNVTNADGNGLSVSVTYDQPCQSVAVSAPTYAATGATGSVSVTAPFDCSWDASTGSSWISFTTPTSGTGNGSITFNLADNTNPEQRTGFIAVSRRSVAVSQKGTATYATPMNPSFGSGVQATIPITFDDPKGNGDIGYARIVFGNDSSCEIDVSQSGGFVAFFVYDAASGSFSPFIAPGDSVTYGNGRCSLTGTGTTVTRNGNQLQLVLNMSFDLSFAGSHRVTASVCDSAYPLGCSSDITLGTWQVPLAPSISQVMPNTGKQGTSLSVTAFGANTHFSNSSIITVSGTGVSVSGISAYSPTQVSATFTVDANATAGTRTLTITSGTEIVTGTFTVGASGFVTVSPLSLYFGKQFAGTTSPAQPLTLKNTGNAALAISSINAVGEFAVTHNCPSSLAINASCTINVTFKPLLGGYRHGNVVINDDAAGAPHYVPLTGLGDTAVAVIRPDRLTRSTPVASVSPGGARSLAVALPRNTSPNAHFTCAGTAQLSCSIDSIETKASVRYLNLFVWADSAATDGDYEISVTSKDGQKRKTVKIPIDVTNGEMPDDDSSRL